MNVITSRRRLLEVAGNMGALAGGLALLSSGCALLPFAAKARVPRIGVLVPGSREAYADRSDAFLQGLRDLGYVEGQTIAIEWRYTPEGTENQFAEMASELVRLSMDVIVVDGSTVAVQAAKQATSTIPIVFLVLTSPVETGLVASLARPGGNLTGITSSAPGQFAKWAQVLQDVVPGLTRPVVLVFPSNPTTVAVWDEFRTAGESAGLQVQRIDLQSAEELAVAFEEATLRGADAVVIAAIALLIPVRERVAELALRHGLPGITLGRDFAAAGLLMSYGANPLALRRHAAVYIDKILRGSKPADLPVELPTVFDFVVNVKTLQALGLTIPPSLLPVVTEWIQ